MTATSKPEFTLYYADHQGNAANSTYPHPITVRDVADLEQAVSHDHVAAAYRNNHRSTADFLQSDCYPFDVDNGETDDPTLWVTPDDVRRAFPGVAFYVVYSRNHMKEKNGKAPRPKFHVYMPDTLTRDKDAYRRQKDAVCAYFPAFDRNARDAARFFFGVDKPKVEYTEGDRLLSEFMATVGGEIIPAGQRNSTLSQFAGRVLKKYGEQSGQARQAFDEKAAKCSPPVDEGELATIWNSALGFYRQIVLANPDYVPPDAYAETDALMPSDFSDVGESLVLAGKYHGVLRHSAATKYLIFDGKAWVENEARARGCLHELTERQLAAHLPQIMKVAAHMEEARKNGNKALIAEAKQAYDQAIAYEKFILRCRNSKNITGIMREAQTPLEISVRELDQNPFLLNTPGGEVDLRTGKLLPHNPEHFHTKITAVAPSDEGADKWAAFLKVITCGNSALEEYLQLTSGQEVIGAVYSENLFIIYGGGRNGKSTYYNAKGRVLGDYTGQITAESLTTGRKSGKNWELAGIRGKRLILAPELEEGTRLDASFVKKICSTDKITGEKKYKDPFDFEPSHTVALFTNHLPRVGSNDAGTWRRLIVIPFNAVIEGKDDIKNYADYLYRHAGGAILRWIIEGARKFIQAGYRIEPPEVVTQAIAAYRKQNDWLSNYLTECCEMDEAYKHKSGDLYANYRAYCISTGDYARSAADFKAAIEGAGFSTKRTQNGAWVYGLRLSQDNMHDRVKPL